MKDDATGRAEPTTCRPSCRVASARVVMSGSAREGYLFHDLSVGGSTGARPRKR